MSNRDSLGFGDLLPQDVIDIFAQEKHSKRGRKKRTRSLGRAFGLFKRKKKKNLGSNGQSHGLGPALDLALDGHRAVHQGGHKGGQKSGRHLQGNSHALPKLKDDDEVSSPPKIQENVFIESNRHKYVEDLHTEAQEGLKMIQQEESNIGMEFRDNESTVSTATAQTDGESTGFVTDSTIPDTSSVVSMQSSVSSRSSRHGLTRQGSTFRPLDSGKKSEKTKTRRKPRKAVAGIPRHVRRELGLDREGWALPHALNEEQLYNGEAGLSPTIDGPQHKAESSKESGAGLKTSNIIHPLSKDKVEQLNAAHAGHRDDLALLHRLSPLLAGEDRPRSLAVPWMTTSSSLQQQPPSPVMTMSPQAAYLSKIIPNAVLPPSIDVVEISRSSRRSSVRTISKSNLISSPSPSRASSRASSTRTWSSNITSASRYNAPNQSDNSCWSNSESSETLVSESSTISSSSTPKQTSQSVSAKEYRVKVNSSNSSSKVINKGDQFSNDGQFARSLSVMKPKRAPLPPSRSISLHNKKRRSRDLIEVGVVPGKHSTSAKNKEKENIQPGSPVVPSGTLDSPGYHGDTSSLDDSTGSSSFALIKSQLQEPKTEDSKKDAEMVQKEASNEKQESLKENKVISPSSGYSSQDGMSPQFSKQSHSSSPKHKGFLAKIQLFFSGSTSTGLGPTLSAQPEVAKNLKSTGDLKPDTSVSPSVKTLRELFNIPPPPKIHAPPPPPPEVWSQNHRSIELLLGPPAPGQTYTIVKKNPKDRRQQRQSPSVSTEGSVKSLVVERKHKNPTAESVNGSQGVVRVPDAKTVQESECLYAKVDKNNRERLAPNGDLKEIGKDEKVRVSEMLNGILVKAVDKQGAMRDAEGQNVSVKASSDTLPTISLVRISPSVSSKQVDHHVQSTMRETTKVTSVSSAQVASPDSPWPPPPPPTSQVGIRRSVEMDFPLPPPPLFGEGGLVLSPKMEVEQVNVTTRGGPEKICSSQEVVHQSLSIPPPPPYTAPPPPTITKVLPQNEVSPPPHPVTSKESTTFVVQDVVPPVTVLSSLVKEAPPPVSIVEVSNLSSKEVSATKDSTPPLTKEASQSIREAAPERNFAPPQNIPPPPPLPSQLQPLKQESISLEPETKDLSNSILIPPNSIPPPPPLAPLLKSSVVIQATDDDSGTDEVPPSPPFEFKNTPLLKEAEEPAPSPPLSIPLPPPLPVHVPASIKHQSSPLSTENQNQEKTSAPEVHKEPTPMITPSLLQMVKLRSVNSSPEPTEVYEQVSASDVQEKPTSTVTPSLLQMVKLRSINNSPEPAKNVKEEATFNGSPSVMQKVKLRSINNSPEPSEPGKGVKEKVVSTIPFSDLQAVELQSAESSPEPSEAVTGVKEAVSTGISGVQTVKLPSINNNPEPSKAQEKPEPEVKVNQQPDKQLPTSSNEAPQKPIRKSLIMISPTSTTPPVIITSEPTPPKPKSIVIPPTSTAVSPVKKSPTTTTSVSMNLQEAIRLRTAARTKENPASRLSLHSPLSPSDFFKSPTSTASFIFSKSNTRVATEMKIKQEDKETVQKKMENPSVTKVTSEAESKMGGKVPPPVAKKPNPKSKEAEVSEAVEQTAGQEAQHDGIKDGTEKINGTAGTVQEETPSA